MTMTATTTTDYDSITETVQLYIDCATSGRREDMKSAFHPDATVLGYMGDDVYVGSIDRIIAWNDDNGSGSEFRARIDDIELSNSVASVRVEIDDWNGQYVTDLFTLRKFDAGWKIMNGVFHLPA